ncbi:MAG: PPC domain-containing protein [Aridibacter famidurans]|nr:PPC domain-containing protein [Aridibacter famidurans]
MNRKTQQALAHLVLAILCMAAAAPGQSSGASDVRPIRPVKGKKLILKGAVRDGDEVVYRFNARGGQSVEIKIKGRDADFSLYFVRGQDAQTVASDTKSWNGSLPSGSRGVCEIAVHSTYKLAGYTLEVLVK